MAKIRGTILLATPAPVTEADVGPIEPARKGGKKSKGREPSAPNPALPVALPPLLLGDVSASLPAELRDAAELLLASGFRAKAGELAQTLIRLRGEPHRVAVIGTGPGRDAERAEALCKVGGAALRWARRSARPGEPADEKGPLEVALHLPTVPGLGVAEAAEAIATGAVLASFEFSEFEGTRRRKVRDAARTVRLRLVGPAEAEVDAGLRRARAIAESVNYARTVASRPGNVINPVSLVNVATELAKETRLKLSVLDDKQLRKLGMGGLTAVGGGSPTPPRLLTLEYRPAGAVNGGRPLLIVGKTITFDTGGVSIKPADRMGRMIYDKAGGMAVLGLMRALSLLETRAHVVGILAAAENHVSGEAYRPGDILKLYNGVTVEVTNTDAEGRLVLVDAISWGITQYKPSAVVDLATLTGGVTIALGLNIAGLFSNDDELAGRLISAGAKSGERLWRLPLDDDHREQLKSDHADVVNSAGRYGSAILGAAFVSLALPEKPRVPWAHLDIAGTGDTEKELPYLGKGATGFGVRTLLRWIEETVARAGAEKQ